MRYADTLLADGEIIVLRSRQHWLALIAKARWALLAWLVAIVALIVIALFGLRGHGRRRPSSAASPWRLSSSAWCSSSCTPGAGGRRTTSSPTGG